MPSNNIDASKSSSNTHTVLGGFVVQNAALK